MTEPDWCDHCDAHIAPMGVAEYVWSWICWHIAMHWPNRLFANRTHLEILPWAGNIAYRCVCRRNNFRKARRPMTEVELAARKFRAPEILVRFCFWALGWTGGAIANRVISGSWRFHSDVLVGMLIAAVFVYFDPPRTVAAQ